MNIRVITSITMAALLIAGSADVLASDDDRYEREYQGEYSEHGKYKRNKYIKGYKYREHEGYYDDDGDELGEYGDSYRLAHRHHRHNIPHARGTCNP